MNPRMHKGGGHVNPRILRIDFDGAERAGHWLDFDASASRGRGESMLATGHSTGGQRHSLEIP